MTYALTVGQLAHATGVPAKTIRYYEQVGVLPAPRRSATGYRQYTQRDVHRLLFIRRARVLGLSLSSIKAFSAELDGGQCLAMRPRLKHLVTEQLRMVRAQIAECQLIEQQLAQVLQRLLTIPPSDHADGCRCLELESLTLLPTTTQGSCGCGCGCDEGSSAGPVFEVEAVKRSLQTALGGGVGARVLGK